MLKRQQIIFKVLFFLLISISISKAELIKPKSSIVPSDVVKIQLTALQKNDLDYKEELMEELLNITHLFSTKMYSNRKTKVFEYVV